MRKKTAFKEALAELPGELWKFIQAFIPFLFFYGIVFAPFGCIVWFGTDLLLGIGIPRVILLWGARILGVAFGIVASAIMIAIAKDAAPEDPMKSRIPTLGIAASIAINVLLWI